MPAPDLVHADHTLASRIEAAEATQIEALARIVEARLPERGAAVLHVAGGVAAFAGPSLSVSRAAGLGMSGPVEPADVDALEAFFRDRGTPARILVSPFADSSLFEQLGERGFRLVELDTVLARALDVDPEERAPAPDGDVVVRQAGLEEAAAWVRASLRGFSGSDEPPPPDPVAIFEAAFHVPEVMYLFASIGGAVVGTAGLRFHGRTAHLFAASTQAAARGRGAQRALIEARLALARARGCDLAFTATAAGSASQRNFERRGFLRVYSRALMIKRFDGG